MDLIGRTHELAILEQSLGAARAGAPRLVTLSGEAGIGKSRLVAGAVERAHRDGFIVAIGACYEQDQALPFAPWLEALRSPVIGEDPASRSALLEEQVGLLAELRGTAFDTALEPEPARRRLFDAVAGYLLRLVNERPLLLVLEDLQWSDASSLDLLRFIIRRTAGGPVLLLLTYRRDDDSPPLRQLLAELDRQPWAQELALAPLNAGETEALIRARLGARQPVRADFLNLIVSLTDGNPFFIEEVLRAERVPGTPGVPDVAGAPARLDLWSEGELAAHVRLPRSVREAVLGRAARLTPDARRLLALAAVVGRHVDFALVQALMDVDEAHLLDLARELIAAHLLVEASADELVFRHALTREAVYGTLLGRERRNLHRQVLAAMEARYASSIAEHVAGLAYHAYAGEDWVKALAYSQTAGDRAQALYAPHESVVHYSRALEAARQLAQNPPPALLSARAQAYEYLGEFDASRADYERVLAQARAAGDRHAEWQALLDLAFLWAARDYTRSGGYLQQALSLARTLADLAAEALSLARVGNWQFNQMQLPQALALYDQALDIFRGLGDRPGIAETLDHLGMAKYVQGDIIAGRAYFDEAIGLFRELGNKRRLAQCLIMLPLAYRFNTEILGRFDPAELLAAGQAGLQMARAMGWRAGELQAHGRQSQYARESGDYSQAFDAAIQGLAIAEEIGHVGLLAAVHWSIGDVYLDLFDPDRAAPHVEQSRTLARASGSAVWEHHSGIVLARLCLMRGDWPAAEAALGPRTGLPEAGMPTQQREKWLAWAELLLARHDSAAGLALIDRLIATTLHVEQYGPHAVPSLSLLRGQALLALDRPGEAASELAAAQEVAQVQGKRPLLWRMAVAQGRAAQAQGDRAAALQAFTAAAELIDEIAQGIPDLELRRSFVTGAGAGLPRPRPPTPRRAESQAFDGLSAREREVAAWITTGKSNRQIAETLVIAERTVDRHVANIMTKLGYNSRAQIAAWAVEHRLRVEDIRGN